MQDNGKVLFMWEGNNGKYFALVSYWIGTGYQNVEREVSKDIYDLWNLGE